MIVQSLLCCFSEVDCNQNDVHDVYQAIFCCNVSPWIPVVVAGSGTKSQRDYNNVNNVNLCVPVYVPGGHSEYG